MKVVVNKQQAQKLIDVLNDWLKTIWDEAVLYNDEYPELESLVEVIKK